MEFDLNDPDFFNDPEIVELLEARAAAEGCSSEELKTIAKKAYNLPRWFDSDPLKNLDGLWQLLQVVPWDRIEAIRQQMIEEDSSKANLTKLDVFVQIIRDQTEREIALLPEKERLEALLAEDIEDQSSRPSHLKTSVLLLLRPLSVLLLGGLILSLLPRFISLIGS